MQLEVKDIHVSYGKVRALHGVSLAVQSGGLATIIGANGAGKSTTLRAISGLTPLARGEIWFEGQRIDGLSPERVATLGIGHVPEGRRVFPDLTVEENLRTGAFRRRDRAQIPRDLAGVYEQFPQLRDRRGVFARLLSGGEQQMLAIGRALMSRPRLLLLDEPSMGLAPVIVEGIARILHDIRSEGIPILLVEQNAELALDLADYAYVLETGAIALEGEAQQLHGDPHVQRAYLGA